MLQESVTRGYYVTITTVAPMSSTLFRAISKKKEQSQEALNLKTENAYCLEKRTEQNVYKIHLEGKTT